MQKKKKKVKEKNKHQLIGKEAWNGSEEIMTH